MCICTVKGMFFLMNLGFTYSQEFLCKHSISNKFRITLIVCILPTVTKGLVRSGSNRFRTSEPTKLQAFKKVQMRDQ